MQIIGPLPERPCRQVDRVREISVALSGTRRLVRGETCSNSCTLRQGANHRSSMQILANGGYMGLYRPGCAATLSRDPACRILFSSHCTKARHAGCLDPPGHYRWPSNRGLEMRAALEARAHPTWSRSLSDPGCKCAARSVDLSRRLPPSFSATAIACAARALADGCSHATLVPLVCSSRDAGSDIGVGPSRRCPHSFQPGRDCASPTCGVLRPTPHHHSPPRQCAARPPLREFSVASSCLSPSTAPVCTVVSGAPR